MNNQIMEEEAVILVQDMVADAMVRAELIKPGMKLSCDYLQYGMRELRRIFESYPETSSSG